MKNVLFIASHLCSGSDYLVDILNENERIQIYSDKLSFEHPLVLDHLCQRNHKLNSSAAIYGSQILHNQDFSCKSLYKISKFIYVVRDATSTIKLILANFKEYSALFACRYYCFRLRRLYEMACSTPNAVLVTYSSLLNQKKLTPIEEYLFLKKDLDYLQKPVSVDLDSIQVSNKILEYAQDCFETYFYKMKNLNLKVIS